jgi:L-asparaginase II
MPVPAPIAEVWRGPIAESLHNGHIVVSDQSGIIEAWGDPEAIILPRSSAKMMQALPLVATGAAREFGLNSEHLALAGSYRPVRKRSALWARGVARQRAEASDDPRR